MCVWGGGGGCLKNRCEIMFSMFPALCVNVVNVSCTLYTPESPCHIMLKLFCFPGEIEILVTNMFGDYIFPRFLVFLSFTGNLHNKREQHLAYVRQRKELLNSGISLKPGDRNLPLEHHRPPGGVCKVYLLGLQRNVRRELRAGF